MAINRHRFYAGPLGALRALPPHAADGAPEFALVRPAAVHTALSGRSTEDSTGRTRRGWNLAWKWITEDEETWLQALQRRTANAPLRFIDPRKRNLVPEDVATGGSRTRGVSAFTRTGAGTLVYTLSGVPTDFTGVLPGRLVWNGVTNTATLYGTLEKLPILSGSTYRVSAYVKTTTTFRFSARPFNTSDVEQAAVTDATNNASTAGVWTRLSWLYTPAVGIGSAYLGLTATGSGNVETTGWQCQIDEPLKAWTYGYGCPEVRISPAASGSYWRAKYHNLAFQVLEV